MPIVESIALELFKQKQPAALIRVEYPTGSRLLGVTMVQRSAFERGSKRGERIIDIELKMIVSDLLFHLLTVQAYGPAHVSAGDSCNNGAIISKRDMETLVPLAGGATGTGAETYKVVGPVRDNGNIDNSTAEGGFNLAEERCDIERITKGALAVIEEGQQASSIPLCAIWRSRPLVEGDLLLSVCFADLFSLHPRGCNSRLTVDELVTRWRCDSSRVVE